MDKLRDVGQAPNKFLERTLLKEAILNQEYQSVLTGLDLLDVPPSVEKCKLEIKKREPSSSSTERLLHSGEQEWLNRRDQAGATLTILEMILLKRKV